MSLILVEKVKNIKQNSGGAAGAQSGGLTSSASSKNNKY